MSSDLTIRGNNRSIWYDELINSPRKGYVLREIFSHIKIYGEPVDLHSGGQTGVIFDVVGMLTEFGLRSQIIAEMTSESKVNVRTCTVVGIELGGALIAVSIATLHQRPFGVYRKNGELIMPKTLGAAERDVWLVDDVYTTGNSLREAKEVLEKEGWHIIGETVAINREIMRA